MYEVEVKIRTSHDSVRSQLNELDESDATHATVQQTDTYYDAPHRDFAATDEALRIREEIDGEETTQLTYKGPLVDDASKTREESEIVIDNRETMADILCRLGFSPVAVVEKERERYVLDEYTVTLDTVSDLGEFVEVERVSEDGEIETARNGAFSLLRELGLDPENQIRTSYLGLQLDNNQ